MIRYHIAAAEALGPNTGLSPAERQELGAQLPRGTLRRFSDNGLQLNAVLQRLGSAADETVYMASTFAEVRALEGFLESFPHPSPARFQTSVHPSGVQQGRVVGQNPLRNLIPMTGQTALGLLALRNALFSGAPSVLLVGGEEVGSWLADLGIASREGYAFGLRLTRDTGPDPLGSVDWHVEGANEAAPVNDLRSLFAAISERCNARFSHPDIGTVVLNWR